MRSFSPVRLTFLTTVAITASCSSGGSGNGESKTIAKNGGDNQSATVLTAVTTRPVVKITDQNGDPVAGITVTFAVATGGGVATDKIATTASNGTATVGSWILGANPGANTLTATAAGVTGSPVTFTATGTAATNAVPKTITVDAGNNQSAGAGTSVTVPPAVKVVDAGGAPIANALVFFTVASGGGTIAGGSSSTSATIHTNASGVAALTGWTLGPVPGANTLTASTGASGVTGDPITFTATATAAVFSPVSDLSISGNLSYGSVNIPAGVTVTLTADASITTTGTFTLAGRISGNCFSLTLTVGGTFTSTGNINTGCVAPTASPPAVTIVATGGYQVTGGTFTLGGSLNLTNDAALNDGVFAAAPAPTIRDGAGNLRAGVCSVGGVSFTAFPVKARNGTNGVTAGSGDPGSNWTLQCTGELDLLGGVSVVGQDGGDGGVGTGVATASGGNGGAGGTIKVRANNGNLVLGPTQNSVTSGSGGAGGAATATNPAVGTPGGSATSTGGNGNAPGNIVLQAHNGGITVSGALTLSMGNGGAGGAATSTAGNGQTVCPAPGTGGAATATAGAGGSTPAATLTATGSVAGLGSVTVNGGAAGDGGAAKSTAGTGGAGLEGCKAGAAGGASSATGGQGGNAQVKNSAGVLIANGGHGGAMEIVNGKGGFGFAGCGATLQAGGAGGAGGAVGGKNGAGGTGLQNGAPGAATLTTVGNGGNGGDGIGPGTGGASGANNTNLSVVANTTQPTLQLGTPGSWCPISKTAIFSITTPATDDPSNHEAVLLLVGSRATNITTTGAWAGLFPGPPILFFCTFNASNGVITCTQSGFTYMARTITNATFTGTWNGTQLVGDMVITIQGQANTVKYHIVDP